MSIVETVRGRACPILCTLAVSLVVLAGCGGSQPPPVETRAEASPAADPSAIEPSGPPSANRFSYQPPGASPSAVLSQRVTSSFDQVWDQAVGSLRDAGFSFSQLDEREGLLVAVYAGEPGDRQ